MTREKYTHRQTGGQEEIAPHPTAAWLRDYITEVEAAKKTGQLFFLRELIDKLVPGPGETHRDAYHSDPIRDELHRLTLIDAMRLFSVVHSLLGGLIDTDEGGIKWIDPVAVTRMRKLADYFSNQLEDLYGSFNASVATRAAMAMEAVNHDKAVRAKGGSR